MIYSAQVTERLDCTDLRIIYLVLRMFRLEIRTEAAVVLIKHYKYHVFVQQCIICSSLSLHGPQNLRRNIIYRLSVS